MEQERRNKLTALLPVALLTVLALLMVSLMLTLPYDLPGTTPPNTYANLSNGGLVAEDGSMLYFVNGKGVLYCLSGANTYRVDEGADSLCPYENGIVYRRTSGEVVFSDFRGQGKTTLLTGVERMALAGNWVFFTRADGELCKRSLQTGQEKKLGLKVKDFLIAATAVLYTDPDGRLYTARTDGSHSEPFLAQPVDAFTRYQSYVFYVRDGMLSSVASGNAASKKTYFAVDEFNITDTGVLFFTDESGLHTYDLADAAAVVRDVETLGEGAHGLFTWGEKLLYYNADGQLICCLKDGSEAEILG